MAPASSGGCGGSQLNFKGTWEAAAAVLLPFSGSWIEPLLPSTAGGFTVSSAALRLRRRDTTTQMMATRASTRNAPSSDAIKGAASDAAAFCAQATFPRSISYNNAIMSDKQAQAALHSCPLRW